MERVTGIGGIFFKTQNRSQMLEWYQQHLGIAMEDWGGTQFSWRETKNPEQTGSTTLALFDENSSYFNRPFMINFRVENLDALLQALREEGVTVVDEVQDFEYGRFGWIIDPEGNRIELWEPKMDW